MARVLMEQTFEQPMSDEALSVLGKRIDDCLTVRDGAWARSYLSVDRRRIICEFEAPDAEAVRQALRSSGVTADRVWTALVFDAGEYPEARQRLEKVRAKLG